MVVSESQGKQRSYRVLVSRQELLLMGLRKAMLLPSFGEQIRVVLLLGFGEHTRVVARKT